MRIKIDKAGRIVLPKPIRDRLQLRPGRDIELQEFPDRILLRVPKQAPSMVRRNGIWMHLGKLSRRLAWSHVVEDACEERINEVLQFVMRS
jgi:AbrB family looped-hinge helix DNA binding protein